MPDLPSDSAQTVDLGETDGLSFVMIPDGATLPPQPKQVQDTLKVVVLTAKLADKFRAASPVLRLTEARMKGSATRVQYSKQDELTLLQVAAILPSAVDLSAKVITMDAHVTDFRAWDKSAIDPILEPIR